MARIPRNYLAELHTLGKTFSSMARELNRHPSTISRWARGITSPPSVLYEPIRNVSRRYMYQTAREAGMSVAQAGARRRFKPEAIAPDIDWLDNVINTLWRDWNVKHPDPSDPNHISKDEIRRRIEKGIRSKSKEEIENY